MASLLLLGLCLTFACTISVFCLGLHSSWSLILAQFRLIWGGGSAWPLRCSYWALTFGGLFAGARRNRWDSFCLVGLTSIHYFLLFFILFRWSSTSFIAFMLRFAFWRFGDSSRGRPFGIHDFSLNFSRTFGFENLQRLWRLFVIAKNQSLICFTIAVLQLF